jgi:hypothetical protein
MHKSDTKLHFQIKYGYERDTFIVFQILMRKNIGVDSAEA